MPSRKEAEYTCLPFKFDLRVATTYDESSFWKGSGKFLKSTENYTDKLAQSLMQGFSRAQARKAHQILTAEVLPVKKDFRPTTLKI